MHLNKWGDLVSDLPTAGTTSVGKTNWMPIIGLGLTVLTLAASGLQYINRVEAKADYALAQIADMKQIQRQLAQDNRSDLTQINAKLDNLTLLVGRSTANGKY